MDTAKLIEMGGTEQKDGSNHRIYFSNLAEILEFNVIRFSFGSIRSATLAGIEMSISSARKLALELYEGKYYYDVSTGQFVSHKLSAPTVARVEDALSAKLASLKKETFMYDTRFQLYRLGFDEEAGYWKPEDAPLVDGLHPQDCNDYLNEMSCDYWLLGRDEQPDYITDIRAKTNADGWFYAALIGDDERVAYYIMTRVEPEEK